MVLSQGLNPHPQTLDSLGGWCWPTLALGPGACSDAQDALPFVCGIYTWKLKSQAELS